MSKSERIFKIDDINIVNDYFKIVIGYHNYMILYDTNGILYYKGFNSNVVYDSYMNDDRRFSFAQNDEIKLNEDNLNKYATFFNQILEFDKSYLMINDGLITNLIASKKDNGAYITANILNDKDELYKKVEVNRDELQKYLSSGSIYFNSNNFYISIIDLNGILYNVSLKSDDELINDEKERLTNICNTSYKINDSEMKNYIDSCKNRLDAMNNLNYIYPFNFIESKIMIKYDCNGNLNVEKFDVNYLDSNKYQLNIYKYPVMRNSKIINFQKVKK